MNRNIIIVLAGGVLIAVLVAVLVQVSLDGSKTAQPVAEDRVDVLVAAKDLKMGDEITAEDLRWQEWPKSAVFPGAVVNSEDIEAKDALAGRLNRSIAAGEPVLEHSVVQDNDKLADVLPKGMRAVAINVKAETMAGGFIGPGDYVDVILTYDAPRIVLDEDDEVAKRVSESTVSKFAAETILENVKVLAVDQMSEREEGDEAVVGRTVTLAVALQDAERLALAAEMGLPVLALRSIGDDATTSEKWPVITDRRMTNIVDNVYNEYWKEKAQDGYGAGSENTAGVRRPFVRIYNGSLVQTVPTN